MIARFLKHVVAPIALLSPKATPPPEWPDKLAPLSAEEEASFQAWFGCPSSDQRAKRFLGIAP